MDIEVTPKKWYVVSGATGSTVSKPDGTVIATVPAGGQTAFLATTYTVVTSNAKVEVVESTFNFALAMLGLQGGGNSGDEPTEVPSGYLPALFLERTSAQYIDTGVTLTGDSVVSFTYQTVARGGSSDNGCIFGARESATSRAFTYYDRYNSGSGNMYFGYNNVSQNMARSLTSETVTHVEISGPSWRAVNSVRTLSHEFTYGSFETYTAYLFTYHLANGVDARGFDGRIFTFTIGQPNEKQRDFIPAIDKNGKPCMYDKVTSQPFYNSGSGSFIVGLTEAQARKLWKLPADATTKTMTISLPQSAFVDTETGEIADAEINAALETAELKGWVITKQYYTES